MYPAEGQRNILKSTAPITDEEYEECESYMEELGIVDGYVQQKASSDKMFIPAFDGTGVLKREE